MSLALQEDLLGLKTRVFRQRTERDVLISQGLRADCPSSLSGFSLWQEEKGLGIGSCLWCLIDCVLRGLLLLLYFSNLMKGAIWSWWDSICIWTVGCSSSVTQGVPEQTETLESIWSGIEHHAQVGICVDQQTTGFLPSSSERLLNHLSCYWKCYNNNYKWFFAS